MSRRLESIVRAAARRPGRVLALVALVVGLGAALAVLRLEPSAATRALTGQGSDAAQATERYRARFGDHAVVVLVRGDVPRLVLTGNLSRLLGLEGCLSGNAPRGAPVPGGARSPCAALSRDRPVQVVYGPGTFINSAVGEVQDQLAVRVRAQQAEAARKAAAARRLAARRGLPPAEQRRLAAAARELVQARFVRDLLALNVRYGLGLTGAPRLDDADFVSALVFDPARGASTPKSRFAYLFPTASSAAIQVRLKPGLSDGERRRAIEDVRAAVAMPEWRLDGADYTVTGVPVLADDLAGALADSLLDLLAVAVVVMALVLAVVFRARRRLVPLVVALGAVAITFGAMGLLGAPLTMAAIAALPVLLGLAVDYAIQFQARVAEGQAQGLGVQAAAVRAARVGAPAIAVAALATAVGFAVLVLSPVPMVRGFGALLVGGVLGAFLLALTAGTAALALGGGHPRTRRGPAARSLRGAEELLGAAGRRLRRPGGAALRLAVQRPVVVLAAGLALAVAGWAADARAPVLSDLRELVPRDLRALRDLDTLQRTTGVAGEVDVVVEGRDLTDPKVVAWMRDYQTELLGRFGYSAENGCGRAALCPALSLPDLFRTQRASADRRRIRALLDAVPPYFSQAVITRDRRTANLGFGIRLMSLERQQAVIEVMRERLRPPPGVRARVGGLPVLAAEANAALSSPLRRLLTVLAGLLAVGLALLAAYRRWERAWVPLVPVVLATGWSGLVLFALGVPLNPLSAALGALVIAIATEFSVLLCARFWAEARTGTVEAALRRTYRSTGTAVLASGTTVLAGFAVLAFSDVRMLRDFGIVTVVGLAVSLLGVIAVLPSVIVLAARRGERRPRAAPPAPVQRRPAAATEREAAVR